MNTTYLSSVNFVREKMYQLLLPVIVCLLACQTVSAESGTPGNNLPTVSIAEGVMTFLGDIGNSRFNTPFIARSGFQIEVQKHTENRLSFSLFLLSGKVFGDEKLINRTLNFQAGIVSEGIQLRYDFISKKNSQQILIPFVSAGIEYVVFHPKADLKDANGNYYHYWKDGTIRSLEQTDSNKTQAVILHRDYNYETELRDANLDGFGKFKQSAIAFPIGIGARFKISENCSMHFSSVCHFTNTDLIDGVTSESLGSRKGNSSNDKFIYTSVSFRYDFSVTNQTSGKTRKSKYKPLIDVSHVDFDALAKEDADHDGVPDINDVEALNPENVKVDANGKPVDTDGDGIPDYRDEELNSAKDALVNEHGKTITEEMLEEQFRRDSLAALPAIKEYLQAVDRLSENDTTPVMKAPAEHDILSNLSKIPKLYRQVDSDFNGVITAQEISTAIDEYLAGKSSYSSEQFYRLIDFFFKQK